MMTMTSASLRLRGDHAPCAGRHATPRLWQCLATAARRHPRATARQRGAAVLMLTLMLVMSASLAAVFVNRSVVFEQRSAVNQARAMRAFEAAEAGLEWATALLNDPTKIDDACLPTQLGKSFRERYLRPDAQVEYVFANTRYASCSIEGDSSLHCQCDAAATPASASGGTGGAGASISSNDGAARFIVAFDAVAGKPNSVALTSTGCTSLSAACDPGAELESFEASASAHASLRLRPALRATPSSALTVGGKLDVTGPLRVVNTDVSSGGTLIDAGGSVTFKAPAASLIFETIPGTPPASRIVEKDAGLSALSKVPAGSEPGDDPMFLAHFGNTPGHFQSAATTKRVDAGSASSNGAAVASAIADGFSAFLVVGDLAMNSADGTFGSAQHPVVIAMSGNLSFHAAPSFHGVVYASAVSATITSSTAAHMTGAWVSRGGLHIKGSGTAAVFRYDAATVDAASKQAGVLVRLPGSWHD